MKTELKPSRRNSYSTLIPLELWSLIVILPLLTFFFCIFFQHIENIHNLVVNRNGYCIHFFWDALMHNAEASRTNTINKLQLELWTSTSNPNNNNSSKKINYIIKLENQAFKICDFDHYFIKVVYSVVSYEKFKNNGTLSVKDRSESATVDLTQTSNGAQSKFAM